MRIPSLFSMDRDVLQMKIASWNVNSIGVRLPHLLDWLGENPVDAICLQEIKCVDEKFPADALLEAGYNSVIYGQKSYNGVAILSKTEASDVVRGFAGDLTSEHRRFIAATVNGVRILNTYFPNGQALDSDKFVFKMHWMKELRNYFDQSCDPVKNVVLCGDYNITIDDRDVYDPVAWKDKIHCSPQEREALQQITNWGLVDTFRIHEQGEGFYSWWDYRDAGWRKNQGLRIDFIMATKPLAEKCAAAWIDKIPRTWDRPSDHAPVVAEFSI